MAEKADKPRTEQVMPMPTLAEIREYADRVEDEYQVEDEDPQ